ncbi:hypothetical protein AMR41_19875 [Hapalosiphon sp. MRB220]|nr:hypothetical protein AMR41_19875 [Hapalosiphon sp. MRB220]
MDNIKEIILENLRYSEKTAGELKDVSDCSYSVLDKALQMLIDAEEIEPGWSNDDFPVRIYKLKRQKEFVPFWRKEQFINK